MDRIVTPGEAICASEALQNGGPAVRFAVFDGAGAVPAFVVRHAGVVRAYLNRCAHRGVELDWVAGEVFDESGTRLLCATHGAAYDPASGRCLGGPCYGKGLAALTVSEVRQQIILIKVEHG